MQQARSPKSQNLTAAAAVLLAGILGFGSGVLMSWLAPSDKFFWVGLVLIPLWFLLELFFESVVAIFGARTKTTRIASTIAVLAGFYIAWFAINGVAP